VIDLTRPAWWLYHLRCAERDMARALARSTGAAYVRLATDLADVRALREHVETELALAEMIQARQCADKD